MGARDFDPATSPLRVFGSMLRFYRNRAALSQDQLGAQVYLTGEMIGKIENGKRAPTEQFTIACEAIPELETRGALLELRTAMKDFLKRRAYPGWFRGWPDKEAAAKVLRNFEPLLVPGLLQTEDYARAVLRTRFGTADDELDEMVAARLGRQALLDRGKPPTLWALLDEHALRRPVGGKYVMRDQVNHVIEMARRPNIVLQLIPAGTGAHEGLRGGAFIIAEADDAPTVAYQDTAARGQILEDADDIAALEEAWSSIQTEALPRAASLALAEEIAKSWL
jgi:transcriptional regulator with XRE-family HTH domain